MLGPAQKPWINDRAGMPGTLAGDERRQQPGPKDLTANGQAG
ncbi:MAG TPA: hypothetical protein VGH53_20685 [Streptosporangiaceae bacterium]|jgi:hypothetical protein